MSFDVRVMRPAFEDADNIFKWIESKGAPLNAVRWYHALFGSIGTLAELAERCPLAPESALVSGIQIHHLLRGKYRILYTVRGDMVAVLHIRGGSRRPATKANLQRALDEAENLE